VYPPFSYTLTIDQPGPKRDGEISEFASYGYDEMAEVMLRLPYNVTLLPHDFADAVKPEQDNVSSAAGEPRGT
jgi:hypothetical protein